MDLVESFVRGGSPLSMGEPVFPGGPVVLRGACLWGKPVVHEVMVPIVGEPDAHGGGGVHGLWNWGS